ncbi:MAG: response regulator transcription factor [Ruminococcaceae bacterium]|nr:response regulator transcription factor [Oscillospiraceae bacterium]
MKDGKKYILVADDEKDIRDVLCLLLGGEGYTVAGARNGREVLELASDDIDLYVLDVNMPEMTGLMAASELRRRFDTPIIFLTAYSSESDKVMGFSVGADDYIVKPFSNAELLMRVRAILRRSVSAPRMEETESKNELVIHDVIIDTDCETVTKNGETVTLTYTEYKILELLAKNRKKIYSLDSIYESIWNENAVGDAAIMVHIKNLRKKLGDSSKEPVYIKTAWGRGYYID